MTLSRIFGLRLLGNFELQDPTGHSPGLVCMAAIHGRTALASCLAIGEWRRVAAPA